MMGKRSEKGVIAVLGVIVILAIAGALAFGYFYYKNNFSQLPTLPTSRIPLTLVLESPVDGTLISDNQVVVKGKTIPGTTVTFYTDTDENSVEADAVGNFEGSLGLVKGINTLTVTAFGETDEKSVTVDIVNDESK